VDNPDTWPTLALLLVKEVVAVQDMVPPRLATIATRKDT